MSTTVLTLPRWSLTNQWSLYDKVHPDEVTTILPSSWATLLRTSLLEASDVGTNEYNILCFLCSVTD